jgi:hypothetical protein
MNVRFSGIGSPAPLRAESVVAAEESCSRIMAIKLANQ